MISSQPNIAQLDAIVKALPGEERKLFQRIFYVGVAQAHLKPPETMRSQIEERYGSAAAVVSQRIVKVTNLVTLEGAIFNPLRARRPLGIKDEMSVVSRLIEETPTDPLNDPHKSTPEDLFGRVVGKHSISASNIAKYDGLHGMVIFHEHNPLLFTREQIIDYIDTGLGWAEKARAEDPAAKYFFFMWNCLWKAGASLIHGHVQVSLGRDMHYAKIEGLRRAALRHKAQYGSSYFEDLYRTHLSVGCGFEKEGVKILASLAPIKDNEVLLMQNGLNRSLKERIYEALTVLRDRKGVASFNLALYMPPLGRVEEDWEGFPVLARVVDRGNLAGRTSDIGTMELYAASIIASDPFELARSLKEGLL